MGETAQGVRHPQPFGPVPGPEGVSFYRGNSGYFTVSGGARQAYPRKPVLDGGFLVQFIRVKGCLRQALAQTIRECPFPVLPRTKNNLVGCYGSRWGARLGNQPRGTLLAVYPQSPCGGLSEEASECQAPPGVRPWALTSVPPISGK